MNDVDSAKALMVLFLNLDYEERARFIAEIESFAYSKLISKINEHASKISNMRQKSLRSLSANKKHDLSEWGAVKKSEQEIASMTDDWIKCLKNIKKVSFDYEL